MTLFAARILFKSPVLARALSPGRPASSPSPCAQSQPLPLCPLRRRRVLLAQELRRRIRTDVRRPVTRQGGVSLRRGLRRAPPAVSPLVPVAEARAGGDGRVGVASRHRRQPGRQKRSGVCQATRRGTGHLPKHAVQFCFFRFLTKAMHKVKCKATLRAACAFILYLYANRFLFPCICSTYEFVEIKHVDCLSICSRTLYDAVCN